MERPAVTHTYGRVEEWDDRDAKYLAARLLPDAWPKVQRRRWSTGPVLDQGQRNACVGFAVKQFLMTTPVRSGLTTPPSPIEIYDLARHLDDDPTNDNSDTGTSVRAGLQAAQAEGHIKTYLWVHTVDDIARWLLRFGGVIIGVRWLDGMEETDTDGYIHARGAFLGNHCTFLKGVDRATETFYGVNSWGPSWGEWGHFKLRFADMGTLLNQNGEAVTATERALPSADRRS